ncbi:MAG: GreA/GreB family elongation factor [Methylotenera sp.]|nr:GreA/GreB family elongation factor [Methylotenera sp.]MDP1754446.1 GreA/GreB family elongation factor [Methylotenera sp.]MDP1958349.1 GreA/GreB family elongation factor [Methylotenera sp.]MDP3304386.1 GreA/GreB family elongation factor [Methylotenera sp.]MDP3943666.1 GreA/GreB family elongation factor [Methylotenera sp.]
MSRAFVNEERFEQAGDDIVERPISEHPNYVTPTGALSLQTLEGSLLEQLDTLKDTTEDTFGKDKIAEIERDLRYVRARLDSAILVDPKTQSHETVLFGATVEVKDGEGAQHKFHIVGEDEADATINKVSWVSPLAKALLGQKISDTVTWQRPVGDITLEILDIHYES